MEQREIDDFWTDAKVRAQLNPARAYTGPNIEDTLPPPAWSFGPDPVTADRLLFLVLEGTKTATASALAEYEADGEALPEPGDLSIVLDGADHPRALIRTTSVRVVPFADVDAAHAYAEGEGDRTLRYWREAHRRFFEAHTSLGQGFPDDVPVVLERFVVLVPTRPTTRSPRAAAPAPAVT